jgi:hypothetical protein
MRQRSSVILWLSVLAGLWLLAPNSLAGSDDCVVCGHPPRETIYTVQDKVTWQRVNICEACNKIFELCFLCGLPVLTNSPSATLLNDGRVLCPRDSKGAVLKAEEGERICRETRDRLDRLLSRFMTFPSTNVTVSVMDRVHIEELFHLAGNDYQCPNVWGLTRTITNQDQLSFKISIMTGLPQNWFRATVAHEYGHAWLASHLTPERRKTLGDDAREGFCELMGVLLMDALGDSEHKAYLFRNAYTRGQIDLFAATEKQYGLNDILDWMQYGKDGLLKAENSGLIHNVDLPRRAAPQATVIPSVAPAPAPISDTLALKAIFWDQKHPLALINGQTFGVNDAANVRVGTSNVSVRCLSISRNSVRIRLSATGEERELALPVK